MKVKFTKLYMLTKLGLKNFKVFEKEQNNVIDFMDYLKKLRDKC